MVAYRANGLNCPTVYMDKSQVIFDTPEVGYNFEEVVKSVKSEWNETYSLSKESVISAAFARYPFLKKRLKN